MGIVRIVHLLLRSFLCYHLELFEAGARARGLACVGAWRVHLGPWLAVLGTRIASLWGVRAEGRAWDIDISLTCHTNSIYAPYDEVGYPNFYFFRKEENSAESQSWIPDTCDEKCSKDQMSSYAVVLQVTTSRCRVGKGHYWERKEKRSGRRGPGNPSAVNLDFFLSESTEDSFVPSLHRV